MKYCIIGIGNHARTKIYPSLIKNKKNIVFTVTRSKKNLIKNSKNFTSIHSAYKFLGNETIYIISTPPSKHYYFLEYLISKNVSYIYCEKPLLTKLIDYKKLFKLLKNNQKLIEIYPYNKTLLYKKFKEFYAINKKNISRIKLKFTIPKLPDRTFRDRKGIQNSLLYDIGCYPLDLLISSNIINEVKTIKNLKIYNLKDQYIINFKYLSLDIVINIGLSKFYSNYVKLTTKNNCKITFNKFFFARNAKKNITYYRKNNKIKNITTINDINTFENYFQNYKDISHKKMLVYLKTSFLNLKILEYINK